jgi:hypothetical protein
MINIQQQLDRDRVFGHFIENLPPSQEYLILSFSPSSIPLKQRWRNNCLSADFLADYLSTFFSSDEAQNKTSIEVLKSAVSYIANELLENAMKYGEAKPASPISLQIHLSQNHIIFELTNSINVNNIIHFQEYIQELITTDPNELYINKLEANALNENETESGLGFLTMINDYDAKLGWKFEAAEPQILEIAVTTMVQLEI